MASYTGELEIDAERGVIYFHADGVGTILRLCQLPRPIPAPGPERCLDLAWGVGVNWPGEPGVLAHLGRRWLECLLCDDWIDDDLVATQEHAMRAHGLTQEDLRRASRLPADKPDARLLVWTLPDGRDWLLALRRDGRR